MGELIKGVLSLRQINLKDLNPETDKLSTLILRIIKK
jgi:hypothetical protein